MACVNMYNSDHHQNNINMISPRISFSNDFVIDSSGPSIKHERPIYRSPDVSVPDFEFSAGGGGSNSTHTMIAADEVFFKGRLLPLKENCERLQKMTLRDELQNDEDGRGAYVTAAATTHQSTTTNRPSKVPIRWKEFLGLRKAPPVPKKHDKNVDAPTAVASLNKPEEINASKPASRLQVRMYV